MGGIQIWKDVGRVSKQIKRYGTVVSCIGVWRTTAATSEAAATATATKKYLSTNTNLARKWLNHSTTIFLHGAQFFIVDYGVVEVGMIDVLLHDSTFKY